MKETEIVSAGRARLQLPHRFVLVGDSKLDELFIQCVCGWQTSHYGLEDKTQNITLLVEADIYQHNASAGVDWGGAHNP